MLRNCPHCGRLLTTPSGTPCPTCLQEEDAAIARITAFLTAGGAPTLATVSQGAPVRMGLLRRLVQSGRVSLGDAGAPAVVCAVCGRELADAATRVCPSCTRRIAPLAPGAASRPGQTPAGRGGFYSQRGGGPT